MPPAQKPHLEARQRRSKFRAAVAGRRCGVAVVNSALERLRGALQDLPAAERRRTIMKMPLRMQTALLTFMQRWHAANLSDNAQNPAATTQTPRKLRRTSQGALDTQLAPCQRAVRQREAIILPFQRAFHVKFQVNTQFMDLRIYTYEFPTMEEAAQAQQILTQLRATFVELEACNPRGWQDVAPVACANLLAQHGTSEEALGLRAWVQLRAHRYLGKKRVSTPAASLRNTLQVHKRLVQARAKSWEALRLEWVHLLRVENGFSEIEASCYADRARRAVLRSHLAEAMQRVLSALARRNSCVGAKARFH